MTDFSYAKFEGKKVQFNNCVFGNGLNNFQNADFGHSIVQFKNTRQIYNYKVKNTRLFIYEALVLPFFELPRIPR